MDPSIGRIVHYMTGEKPGPVCWPAIVTAVDPGGSRDVLLTLFPPQQLPAYTVHPVPYHRPVTERLRSTWHWHTDHEETA